MATFHSLSSLPASAWAQQIFLLLSAPVSPYTLASHSHSLKGDPATSLSPLPLAFFKEGGLIYPRLVLNLSIPPKMTLNS